MPASFPDPVPLAAGAAALAAALAVDAFLVEPAWVAVTRHDLPLADLPAPWEGARVVHLTDLHYGNPRSGFLFRRMVRTVNELEPALILITGDYVLNHASEIKGAAVHLSQLRARHGIVGILGDHDFSRRSRAPREGVVEALLNAGVHLLRNAAVRLPGGLRIIGTDPYSHRIKQANIDAALRGLKGALPHLMLSHSPDILPEAARRGIPVVLCGHTHGGQVVVPFYGPPMTNTKVHRRYASGWSTLEGTRLYTGRGLSSHWSLRFLCRPEIAVFTLKRQESGGEGCEQTAIWAPGG